MSTSSSSCGCRQLGRDSNSLGESTVASCSVPAWRLQRQLTHAMLQVKDRLRVSPQKVGKFGLEKWLASQPIAEIGFQKMASSPSDGVFRGGTDVRSVETID
ncbi:unnamed protein product [Protopolystoma xenopodis]|uniref:Uncharacterized protein n=1 Tax=Protopolystoma xenopodis TaxID=117903 RepID=A0A448XMH3_9PLAT|nr:unnamed protein product [Protopolystoma xenopodis]